jgi:hypothetical protein
VDEFYDPVRGKRASTKDGSGTVGTGLRHLQHIYNKSDVQRCKCYDCVCARKEHSRSWCISEGVIEGVDWLYALAPGSHLCMVKLNTQHDTWKNPKHDFEYCQDWNSTQHAVIMSGSNTDKVQENLKKFSGENIDSYVQISTFTDEIQEVLCRFYISL